VSPLTSTPARILDPGRLAAVHRTGLLDTGPEEAFDRLTRLAATLLDTPFAFVTVVDETRSFWKSCIGVDSTDSAMRQNTVQESFCQYVVQDDAALIVPDARANPRTADNPSIASMGVIAWAGYPVRSPDGHVLSTFCAVDTTIRQWSARDLEILETLAQAAAGEIALWQAVADARTAAMQSQAATTQAEQLADTLQQSLLPPHLPQVPGAEIATVEYGTVLLLAAVQKGVTSPA
jgi:sigma-B regulation protein RsbU (phosphoserine phosphatase)